MYVFRSIITGFRVGTELCLEARPPTRFPLRFRWPLSEELPDVVAGVLDSTILGAGFVGIAIIAAFVEPEEFFFEIGLGNETVVDFRVVAEDFLDATGDDVEAGVTAAVDAFGFELVLLGEEGPVVVDDEDLG